MYLGADEGGGVTQLVFNPLKPHLLYATMRGQRAVHMWDLRMTGVAGGGAPLRVYEHRPHAAQDQGGDEAERARASTNQKIRFDVDPGGQWLSYGAEDGSVSLFDLNGDDSTDLVVGGEGGEDTDQEPRVILPSLSFGAHQDVACSTSFHPSLPFLLSASGSRHWGLSQGPDADSSSSSSDDDEEEDGGRGDTHGGSTQRSTLYAGKPVPRDSSVKMWDLGGAAS